MSGSAAAGPGGRCPQAFRARPGRGASRLMSLIAALAVAATLSGCAGSGSGSGRPQLDVSAAASLEKAFSEYGTRFSPAEVRFSFAGSDALAAQIEQGVHPDVFASANTKLPDALYGKGLVEKPVVFIANRLVIAVPAGSRITSIEDLERPGPTIAVGSATVPVGAYTEKTVGRLPAAGRRRLLANVRDREPDVTGIVGKLTQHAVDAGFLYATDVAAARGQLRAIQLPAALRPRVLYGIAIVKGTAHPAQARAFIAGVRSGAGHADLLNDGFLPAHSR